MSQENVEIVQRAVQAWNADDLDAFLAQLDAGSCAPAIEPGLEGKATTYEVMTARENLGRTAARRGNASPIGPGAPRPGESVLASVTST